MRGSRGCRQSQPPRASALPTEEFYPKEELFNPGLLDKEVNATFDHPIEEAVLRKVLGELGDVRLSD